MCQFALKRKPTCGICVKLRSLLKIHLRRHQSTVKLKSVQQKAKKVAKTSLHLSTPLAEKLPVSAEVDNTLEYLSEVKDFVKVEGTEECSSGRECRNVSVFGVYKGATNIDNEHDGFYIKNEESIKPEKGFVDVAEYDATTDEEVEKTSNFDEIDLLSTLKSSARTNTKCTESISHKKKQEIPSTCHKCGQVYANKFSLTRHLRSEICVRERQNFAQIFVNKSDQAFPQASSQLKPGNIKYDNPVALLFDKEKNKKRERNNEKKKNRLEKREKAADNISHDCNMCECKYTRMHTLRMHVKRQHPLSHACNCGKGFDSPLLLTSHINAEENFSKIHFPLKRRDTFVMLSDKEKYSEIEQNIEKKINRLEKREKEADHISYDCNMCDCKYTRMSKLRKHVQREHPFSHACNCGKGFDSPILLSSHINTEANSINNIHFPLKKMNTFDVLSDKEEFNETERSKEEKIDRLEKREKEAYPTSYDCNMCECKYTRRSTLRAHVRREHTWSHACNCGKGFDSPKLLTSHIEAEANFSKIHFPLKKRDTFDVLSGKEKYDETERSQEKKISRLEKREKSADNIRKKISRLDKREKSADYISYDCNMCDCKYSRMTTLRMHVQRQHPLSHACNCGKAFDSPILLTSHINAEANINKIHFPLKKRDTFDVRFEQMKQKEFPHVCTFCEHVFKAEVELKEHLQSSGDYNEYICDRCEKVFPSEACFKHHALSHNEFKPYVCHLCAETFRTKMNFMEHRHIHMPKTHVCQECNDVFSSIRDLRLHVRENHLAGIFSCFHCEKTFSSRKELNEHVSSTLACWHPKCDICQVALNQAKDVWQHFLQHAETMETPFSCSYENCEKEFPNEKYRMIHWRLHFENMEQREFYPCRHCNKVYSKKFALKRHIMKRHREIEEPFVCDVCEKTFKTATQLDTHSAMHAKDASLICEFCGANFPTKFNLRDHLKRVHGERKFKCDECPAAFKNKHVLIKHKNLHAGLKSHSCQYCGKRFAEKQNLQKHVAIHTGEKRCACPLCDYRCIQSTALKMHMLTHSGECKYRCEDCGLKFKTLSALQQHRKRHRGYKPHACKICGRAFITPYELRLHMRVHSDARPHQCQICGSAFKRPYTLQVHIRGHQRDKKAKGTSTKKELPTLHKETGIARQMDNKQCVKALPTDVNSLSSQLQANSVMNHVEQHFSSSGTMYNSSHAYLPAQVFPAHASNIFLQ